MAPFWRHTLWRKTLLRPMGAIRVYGAAIGASRPPYAAPLLFFIPKNSGHHSHTL